MHKLNVVVVGPNSFISTLNELKHYLKFNISDLNNNLSKIIFNDDKLLLCHQEFLDDKKNLDLIREITCTKILAIENIKIKSNLFNAIIKLPTTISEINNFIESSSARNRFGKNSSIKIKDYFLDKNEKKIKKKDQYLILTEKEIQLLELFLKNSKPISKDKILSTVWNYSSDADTHTVETHIYRLRKKINDKFSDETFILNNKQGYYI
tara:strand:+ start:415 stop:1041 length:627 start_codon:yes stop_codon:yes gene_type:complete